MAHPHRDRHHDKSKWSAGEGDLTKPYGLDKRFQPSRAELARGTRVIDTDNGPGELVIGLRRTVMACHAASRDTSPSSFLSQQRSPARMLSRGVSDHARPWRHYQRAFEFSSRPSLQRSLLQSGAVPVVWAGDGGMGTPARTCAILKPFAAAVAAWVAMGVFSHMPLGPSTLTITSHPPRWVDGMGVRCSNVPPSSGANPHAEASFQPFSVRQASQPHPPCRSRRGACLKPGTNQAFLGGFPRMPLRFTERVRRASSELRSAKTAKLPAPLHAQLILQAQCHGRKESRDISLAT